MAISTSYKVITLNLDILNSSSKTSIGRIDNNNNPTIYYISNYFYIQNTYRLKIKRWKRNSKEIVIKINLWWLY